MKIMCMRIAEDLLLVKNDSCDIEISEKSRRVWNCNCIINHQLAKQVSRNMGVMLNQAASLIALFLLIVLQNTIVVRGNLWPVGKTYRNKIF